MAQRGSPYGDAIKRSGTKYYCYTFHRQDRMRSRARLDITEQQARGGVVYAN